MIKIEVATRIYIDGDGWRIDPRIPQFRLMEIRRAGYLIGEEYASKDVNRLYVMVEDEGAAAVFKLTYL
jgi:hypothetical protein